MLFDFVGWLNISRLFFIGSFFLVVWLCIDALVYTYQQWIIREEYSHGFIIPFISLFLLYLSWPKIRNANKRPVYYGLVFIVVGCITIFLGELSSLYIFVEYALVFLLLGLTFTAYGAEVFRYAAIPILYLLFMFPLPNFFLNNLSERLQIISSSLGVSLIRACDISVFLEGNVIDLGTYKLQVAEACSGLNYLFPLMSIAFLIAYLYRGPFWHKAVLFLSSIPITILMNSFRVGVIGVMVEYWGISMAEGFLHAFEGWAVFMLCMLILLGEVWVFAHVRHRSLGLSDVLLLQPVAVREPSDEQDSSGTRPLSYWPHLASILILLLGLIISHSIKGRQELIPQRLEFSRFPMEIDGWQGHASRLPMKIIDTLKLDDYLLADYVHRDVPGPVNLYIAWYDTQSKGQSVHSPSSCIPGGGWIIEDLRTITAGGIELHGQALKVNRVDIRKGSDHQLVYYWFQQRGRIITNEYLAKWYLFLDGLMLNRTDGSLVRLTTAVSEGESLHEADERLIAFARSVTPLLAAYIPD